MSRKRELHIVEASEFVTIGELVRLTESRYSTLKYYTEEGMIPFVQEEENLTRRYKRVEAIERIEQIKKLKIEGKTIHEIKEILPLIVIPVSKKQRSVNSCGKTVKCR